MPGGSAVFQITFVVGPNSVGRPVVSATPVPFGPRNCDHSEAAGLGTGLVFARDTAVTVKATIAPTPRRAMIILFSFDMMLPCESN
jgi:hypothetical protein